MRRWAGVEVEEEVLRWVVGLEGWWRWMRWVSAKAGILTLDWTMDWTLDWIMDSILYSF